MNPKVTQLVARLREVNHLETEEYHLLLDAVDNCHPVIKKAIDFLISKSLNRIDNKQDLQPVLDRIHDPDLCLEELRQTVARYLLDPALLISDLHFYSELLMALGWNPETHPVNIDGRANLPAAVVFAHLAATGNQQVRNTIAKIIFKGRRKYRKPFENLPEQHPGLAEMLAPYRPAPSALYRRYKAVKDSIFHCEPSFVIPMAIFVVMLAITGIAWAFQKSTKEVNNPAEMPDSTSLTYPAMQSTRTNHTIAEWTESIDADKLAKILDQEDFIIAIMATNDDVRHWLTCYVSQLPRSKDAPIIASGLFSKLLGFDIPNVEVSSWMTVANAASIVQAAGYKDKELVIVQLQLKADQYRLRVVGMKTRRLLYAATLPSPMDDRYAVETVTSRDMLFPLDDGVKSGVLGLDQCLMRVRIAEALTANPHQHFEVQATKAMIYARFSSDKLENENAKNAMKIALGIARTIESQLNSEDNQTLGVFKNVVMLENGLKPEKQNSDDSKG